MFGTDPVAHPTLVFAVEDGAPRQLDLIAYRHHRRHAEASPAASDDTATSAQTKPSPRALRRHGAAAKAEAAKVEAASDTASPAAGADTPYQTVVKPGEKLSDVAERVHSSREALAALNDLKHPKHVKAGTVLKVPYRYTYEVQKGDTLYTISHRFNQDPAAMAKLNGLKTVPTLQPGETIQLPVTAEDTGKRDHASAPGPSPVAAPEKLADAALQEETRHSRRHHPAAAVAESAPAPVAPAASQTAEADPAKLTRAERRRLRREEKASRLAAAAPAYTPAASTPVQSQPSRPPSVATAAPPPSSSPATSPAYAPTPSTLTLPPAYASTSTTPPPTYPPAAPSASMAAAGSTGTQPYYPGTRPYTAPATAALTPSATPYRSPTASSAAASTYAMPGYAARAPSTATATAGASRVASLTTPSYGSSYPAGGYAPSLGRARPVTPTVSGIAGLTPSQITTAGRGRFIWPLRGQVLSPFGDKGTGQHNDGVDIAAVPGSGVRAAAAGEVVYAGSSIPGFGNLVLVKHSGGWVTAYAHLDRIEVRMRDSVAQGDEIGQAGQTGAVDRPQLHFEVRYAPDPTEKARPVDPTLVLPAG